MLLVIDDQNAWHHYGYEANAWRGGQWEMRRGGTIHPKDLIAQSPASQREVELLVEEGFYGIKLNRLIKILLAFFALALAPGAKAGLAGWLTSSACSWDSIQDTGGIRISEPQEKDGRLVLPVEYDASGVIGVTRHPKKINSGLVVRKVQSAQSGNGRIVIRVFTQIEEQSSDPGRIHYADLDDFLPGAYTVYYEDADDSTKFLGRIRVR